jgi:hypothetical protein
MRNLRVGLFRFARAASEQYAPELEGAPAESIPHVR